MENKFCPKCGSPIDNTNIIIPNSEEENIYIGYEETGDWHYECSKYHCNSCNKDSIIDNIT